MPNIQVPPDSTGKTVETATPGSDHRQVIVIGGDTATAELAEVTAGAPSATEYGLFTRSVLRREGQTLTSTPLGISGAYTQTAQDGNEDGTLFVWASAEANENSATNGFTIEEYDGDDDDFTDASHVRTVAAATYTASSVAYIYGTIRGRKWRVKFTNGATGQASFKLTSASSQIPVAPQLDYDTGTGTVSMPVAGIALPGSGGPVAGGTTTNPIVVTDDGNAIIVDGSAVTQPVSAASLPLPSGAATSAAQLPDGHNVTVDNAAGASAVNIQDGGNTITVDGTVTADAGSGPWPVTDNAGSLTVDAPVGTPVNVQISDGTDTALVSVGGALLVDASATTQPVSGTVTVTHPALGGGVEAGAQRVTIANDSTGVLSVDDGGANLSVDWAGTVPPIGAGTEAAALRVTLATDSTGLVSVDDNAGSLTVDQATASNLNAQVVGEIAHDSADSGNPIKLGGKASTNEPTAVAVDDRVNAWFDVHGRLVVVTGHGNPETPVNVTATASGDTAVIGTPGASLSLYICKGSVHNAGASNIQVALQANGSATDVWAAELAAEGGGSLFDFGSRGWKLAANTGLDVNLGATGTVEVNITEYYIAP